jgi:hypothetical protein
MAATAEAQEYYDQLVRAALDGTFPGYDHDDGRCVYRTEDGKHRCAVGIRVPDHFFTEFDTTCWGLFDELPGEVQAAVTPRGFNGEDMLAVQRVHDKTVYGCEWDAVTFLEALNQLRCFAGCRKVNPLKPQEVLA